MPCRRLHKGHKLFPLYSLHILYSFSTDVFTLSGHVVDSRKDTSCSLSSPYIFVTRFLLTSFSLSCPVVDSTKGHKLFPLFSLHIRYSFSTDVFTLSCPVVDSRKDTSCSLSSPSLLLTYSLLVYLSCPVFNSRKDRSTYLFSTDVFTYSCPVVDSPERTQACSLSSPYIFFTRFLLTSLPYRALSSTPQRTTKDIFFTRFLLTSLPYRALSSTPRKDTSCSLSSPYIFYSSTDVFTLSCPVSRKDTSFPSLLLTYSLLVFLLTSLPYRALSSTPERTQAVPSLLLTYSLLVFY